MYHNEGKAGDVYLPPSFQKEKGLTRVLFEWDEEKAAANLRKHRIDFRDAALVFED